MDYYGFFGWWLSITINYYDDKGWWWGSRCTPWTLTDALLRMLILRAGHFFNKVSFLCLLVNIFIFCVVPCCWVSIDICFCGLSSRRDPERGLQSWFRPAKPETRNPKPTVKVGFELRNPKPETRNRLWRLTFPRTDWNPKPETRNRLWRLNRTDRNPKPETRNPTPETDSEDLLSPGPIETRNPKPETRNRLWRLTFPMDWSKPETRNPKPETRNRQRKLVSIDETRNPKPETRNRLESDFWVALRIGTPVIIPLYDLPLMCKWTVQLLTGRSSACLPQPPRTTPQRRWSNTQKNSSAEQLPKSQVVGKSCNDCNVTAVVFNIFQWCYIKNFRSFQRKRVMLRHAGLRTSAVQLHFGSLRSRFVQRCPNLEFGNQENLVIIYVYSFRTSKD